MGRQVGAAAVKGQPAPAAAEGGNASVSVLQVEQPLHPGGSGLARLGIAGAQVTQGQQGSGGIVGIRNTTRKIGPGPAARVGMGEGVQAAELLSQQPVAELSALVRTQVRLQIAGGRKRAQGLGGHPGRQVGIDGPSPVPASRCHQKIHTPQDHGMLHLTAGRQAHDYEAGERNRFQVPAALRLNGLQHLQALPSRQGADQTQEGVSGGVEVVADLADGNQGRQGIADHRQAQPFEPLPGTDGQLEGKLGDPVPGRRYLIRRLRPGHRRSG